MNKNNENINSNPNININTLKKESYLSNKTKNKLGEEYNITLNTLNTKVSNIKNNIPQSEMNIQKEKNYKENNINNEVKDFISEENGRLFIIHNS
jgi:hypothetical protein